MKEAQPNCFISFITLIILFYFIHYLFIQILSVKYANNYVVITYAYNNKCNFFDTKLYR